MRTNGCVALSILFSLAILPSGAVGQADSLAAAAAQDGEDAEENAVKNIIGAHR